MKVRDLFNRYRKLTFDSLAVEILICRASGISKERFWSCPDHDIPDDSYQMRRFKKDITRLEQGEPLAYIIREKEFFGLNLAVGPGVLIPRPETELLVEKALNCLQGKQMVLDIGSGSGNIAIAIAANSQAMVLALEKSRRALRYLRKNVRLSGLEERVKVLEADLFPEQGEIFDLIVSNPPYIPLTEWQELEGSVRDHEPVMALVARRRGLYFYQRILAASRDFLKKDGFLLLEVGYDQCEKVGAIARAAGWNQIEWYDDLSGIPRVCRIGMR